MEIPVQVLSVFTSQSQCRKSNGTLDFMEERKESTANIWFRFVVLVRVGFYPQIRCKGVSWRRKEIKSVMK